MNKQTEALKMVTDILDDELWFPNKYPDEAIPVCFIEALKACKEALEQPAPDWTCDDVDVTNCDANTLEQFCRDNIRLAPFFAMLAGALKQPAQEPVACHCGNPTFNRQTITHTKEKCFEQTKQKPYGYYYFGNFYDTIEDACENEDLQYEELEKFEPIALYTHPAPSWQGLTDDEIVWLCPPFYDEDNLIANEFGFARAIEQALKEKNNG